jgi:1A family penicillin-binding protein
VSTGGYRPRRPRAGWRFAGKLLKKSLPYLVVFFLVGAIGLVGAFAWYSRDLPDPNKIIDRSVAQSTKIYDRTGEHLLYEIHGTQRRTLIDLNNIPKYAVQATIAIEDKTFYEHQGFNVLRTIKSVLYDIVTGTKAQGGSTLTQQFVKNAILTNEKAISRKIKELVLSYQIEQKFTKDEILKLYFNEIPYGSTAYGIESASGIYFGKSAKDLTLAEAAILAAMPQAPSYYSPYGPHKDALISRQHLVLRLMREQGYITADQEKSANEEKIVFKTKREDITAPHFVFMVKSQLAERYGDRLVEQGGLKIITTLDWEKQQLAQQTVDELTPQLKEKYGANNTGLVTIDVESGDVLAMIGSRDFFDDDIDGQVNVATAKLQPGSSFKPFVYAEAFTKGYNPQTVLIDAETSFSNGGAEYRPRNYDGKEYGPVSIRQALAGSLNVPAVKALYLAGVKNVITLAQQLGYTTLNDPDRYGLSLVLGGGEVQLIEHTNGYAALARDGVAQPYFTVLKVEDSKGTVLEEKPQPKQTRVLDKQVVREITSILSDNEARSYIFGANNNLTLSGRPVAAKTGTTNDYRDSWLLGYTPQLATGVWVGNTDHSPMNKGTGANAAGPIWQRYMNRILQAYPSVGFPAPDPVVCDKIMVCGQPYVEKTVRMDSLTNQPATANTPPEQIREQNFKELHSILYYVDKNNPLDPSYPKNPNDDPQYHLWEEAVTRWGAAHGFVSSIPGNDEQFHGPENIPTVSWIKPDQNQTITTPELQLSVNAQAKRGVLKVDYYLDNQYLATANTAPYAITVPIQTSWKNGQYTLRATAYDDVGNSQSANVIITLNIAKTQVNYKLLWLTPEPSQNYTVSSWPKQLSVSIDKIDSVKKLDFYYLYNNQSQFVAAADTITDKKISVPWNPPTAPGVYKFYVVVTDIFGGVTATDEVAVSLQ